MNYYYIDKQSRPIPLTHATETGGTLHFDLPANVTLSETMTFLTDTGMEIRAVFPAEFCAAAMPGSRVTGLVLERLTRPDAEQISEFLKNRR